MSQITTHILNTSEGKPAQGVTVILYKQQDNDWREIARNITNREGRISDLLSDDIVIALGIYKMKFLTRSYFDQRSIKTFYPFIEIVFEIVSQEHYHIPLLLNPFGYTTYRGS